MASGETIWESPRFLLGLRHLGTCHKKEPRDTFLSQVELSPSKVSAFLDPTPHSPVDKLSVSSVFTVHGSFPCSNKNITLGLEKQSPKHVERNDLVMLRAAHSAHLVPAIPQGRPHAQEELANTE